MLEEFAAVAQTISFNPPQIPVLSNLSGELLTPEQATDPAYWVAQVREPVRFADGASYLAAQGVSTALELGPDGVLCAMAQGSFAAADKEAVAVPLLRKDRVRGDGAARCPRRRPGRRRSPGLARLLPGAKRVPLPTYAFQRQRYWLEPAAAGATRARSARAPPTIRCSPPRPRCPVATAPDGGWLLTGRLSLQTHPWLADHAVHGTAILPGTAFVEMALKAAEQVGAEATRGADAGGAAGAARAGCRPGPGQPSAPPTSRAPARSRSTPAPRTATTPTASGSPTPPCGRSARPSASSPRTSPSGRPADAVALEIDSFHERVGEFGLDHDPAARGSKEKAIGTLYELSADFGMVYGPAFQGVREVWLREGELFAEVELGEAQARRGGPVPPAPGAARRRSAPGADGCLGAGGADRASASPSTGGACGCRGPVPAGCGWRSPTRGRTPSA